MRHIVLLGSTGSIGTQTLDVIRKNPGIAEVKALASGGGRVDLMEQQVREFHPETAVIYNEAAARDLQVRLKDTSVRVLSGMEGLLEICRMENADMVVTAMVGMIGLRPTVEAIKSHKTIALANKETLVCAGEYIMRLAAEEQVDILPVDSEHSAIFQCLDGRGPETVRRILLTASGGPFRGWTFDQLKNVTPEQALKHPNWSMGAKITTDSATMMNKGLEMIEAKWLFGVRPDQIEVVVHPQSIVHSAVEFTNGSVIAQMGVPDMRLPIQEALEYPKRGNITVDPLDLFQKSPLTFEKPDEGTFKSIPMARWALEKGGLYPAVYNASNELAVSRFLQRKIGFTGIYREVELALEQYDKGAAHPAAYTLEDVFEVTDPFLTV